MNSFAGLTGIEFEMEILGILMPLVVVHNSHHKILKGFKF
jgi:hypothetical protein